MAELFFLMFHLPSYKYNRTIIYLINTDKQAIIKNVQYKSLYEQDFIALQK